MKKTVVIDLKSFLKNYSKEKGVVTRVTDVGNEFGLSRQTFVNWENTVPDVVSVLFYIVKENPKTNITKALNEWQKPPAVLVFIRDFMKKYKCSFTDIVKEIQTDE